MLTIEIPFMQSPSRIAYYLRKLVFCFAIVSSTYFLSACSTFDGQKNSEVDGYSEAALYELAQKFISNRFWQDAIETLQKLEENYPFGKYAKQAQLELIYAYYQNDQLEAVSVTADRFIRLHPKHRHLDYAYYMKGLATFTRHTGLLGGFTPTDLTTRDPGQAQQSFIYFADLINRFSQ